jgi:hypothetical protein
MVQFIESTSCLIVDLQGEIQVITRHHQECVEIVPRGLKEIHAQNIHHNSVSPREFRD